jgi:hypothetical protein
MGHFSMGNIQMKLSNLPLGRTFARIALSAPGAMSCSDSDPQSLGSAFKNR